MPVSAPKAALVLVLAIGSSSALAAAPAQPPESVDEASVVNRSGARIKRRVARSADGASWSSGGVTGLFDTKLNTTCWPRPAADGKTRCLPIPFGFQPAFSDPKCEVAVASFPIISPSANRALTPFAPPRKETPYAVQVTRVPRSEKSLWRIFRLGRSYSGPLFRRNELQACVPSSDDPSTRHSYLLGSEISATDFVEVSESLATRSGRACAECCLNQSGARLLRKVARTADGAVVPSAGLYDPILAEDCSSELASDGSWRCIPRYPGSAGGYFSDPDCTTSLAITFSRPPKPPLIHEPPINRALEGTVDQASGNQMLRVFSIVGGHAGPVYHRFRSKCLATELRPDLPPWVPRLWSLGSEISPGEFAELSEPTIDPSPTTRAQCTVDPITRSGSRLKLKVVRGTDQSSYASPLPFDTVMRAECSAALAADGKLRCLPDVGTIGEYFADTSCRTPVVAYSSAMRSADRFPQLRFVREEEARCDDPKASSCPVTSAIRLMHVRRVGARYSGPVFRPLPDGSCTDRPRDFTELSYSLVGPEVPPTEFVELTVGIE